MKKTIIINSEKKEIEAEPTRRLIDVLREDLKLTGTKEGCGEGECGACSILINGEAVNSCIILIGQLQDGDTITTIEGLEHDVKLSKLQDSFTKHGAVHCGMCIPGMLISAAALIQKNMNPTNDEIKAAIAGNICRCTGYGKIVDAIKKACE